MWDVRRTSLGAWKMALAMRVSWMVVTESSQDPFSVLDPRACARIWWPKHIPDVVMTGG